MKRLFLLLLVFLSYVNAIEIDEYKTDVYFANGILTDKNASTVNTLLLRDSIRIKRYNDNEEKMYKHIGKVAASYNETHGFGLDILESVLAKLGPTGLVDLLLDTSRERNLETQVKAYKESIEGGHKVLVVAHSQGNLFTQEAYWKLDEWMHKYFDGVSVASPGMYPMIPTAKNPISWDNDLVAWLGIYTKGLIQNDVRRVNWEAFNIDDHVTFSNIKKPIMNYVWKSQVGDVYKNSWKATEDSLVENFDSNVHAFTFYMGLDIKDGDTSEVFKNPFDGSSMKSNKAKILIMNAVDEKITYLEDLESQWLPKKEIGCVCKKKYVEMTHQYDSNGMDKLLKGQEVKNFAGDGAGKIYTVDDTYVRAEYGGETIEKLDEGEVCLKLKSSDTALGEIKGTRQGEIPKAFNGAIDMFLTWNYECDIDMDLEMTGSQYIQQDIKDIEGYGKEHTYIDSVYHTYPGDHYKFEADGEKLPDSTLNEETLAEEPIEIRALLETPTGSYFKVWEAKSFGQLDLGLFAELHVKEKIIPQWICPALNDVPGWYRLYNEDTKRFQCVSCEKPYSVVWYKSNQNRPGYWKCNRPVVYSGGGGRTYNQCTEKEKKETCGCVPCEYIVSGLQKRVENGPLAGADVEIINASELSSVSPTALWKGKTTDKEDIFKSGLLEIPTDKLQQFEDDVYYVVMAEGGNDIDYDDDMKRDIVPVENHGVMHAIIKGSDLKQLPFRVNVLTEAIYQVMGEYMGNNYSQVALEENLDTVARKILSKKLYPADDEPIINYKDILLWTPAVDKRALYKPYNIYVEPIVKHVYADEERYDASYRFIYEPYSSDTPQLSPMVLEIPSGLPNGTIVASFTTQNGKSFASVELEGSYAEHFSVDAQGYLSINKSELIKIGNKYRLQARAVDAGGNKGGFVSLDISVLVPTNIADPSKSVPMFVSADINAIYENSEAGTVVAQTNFEDSNQTIIGYKLIGEDNASFRIDNNGIIYVADNANIDYEKSKLYSFKVAAKNDAGNESFPVRLSVPIKNQLDTPLFDLVVFEHIEENIPLGSVITTIRTDREGLGDIEKFEILSPHMPFTIDSNGTMYVSNYIDYEQKKQYDFYAIARTKYGNSNKIEIHIVVDDQRPEIGIPSLEDLTISVEENTTSGSKIGQLVLDAGATALERIALYGEDDNFRIDVNGSIYLADDATLDYETKTRYDLGARALNSRGWGNEVHIVIEVNNIADQLPTLEKFKKSVEENATAGTLIGHIMMSGASETTINAFELTGTGNENFSIDTNGTIRVSQTAQLDYESKDSYLLKAIASSAVGSSSEVEVIIYILNIPENPPVLKPLTLNIEENATIGTVLGKVEEDVGGDSPIVSYRLDDNSTFSIDANGTLRVEAPLDYETQTRYTLQVTASNVVGESSPVSVTVNIINIPDGEPVLEASNFSVEENSPLGTVVGNVGIINQGRSKILNMNLTGNYSNYFSIDINGTVRVIGELNYELIKVYHLKAIASNDVANSVEVDVVIDILNVIDSPPIIYPRYSSIDMHVDENSVEDTVVGKLRIESESPLHSVVLGRYDSRNFTIDLNGTIRVAKDADLDYEYGNYTYGRYKLVSITATNDDGNTTSYVYVWLNNLPDPTIDSFTGEVLENSLEGTIVGTVNIDSATPVSDIYLSGFGSENFTIDINGTIRVAQNAVLDYEQYTTYRTIAVNAINQYGTNKKLIRIDILDIVDSPPKIGTLAYGTSIAENSQPGTKVGKVTISHETPILNVLLSGEDSEKFTIDLNGTIRVADGAVLDYDVWSTRYLRFVIEASNKFGTNSRSVTISLSNVPDPTLYQTSFWIDENSVEGTVVGTARIDSDEPLLSVSLAGVGSENFIVDLNGTVRVAKNAVLDYESNDRYDYNIRLYATNAYGTNSIRMYVNINNIPDTPPTVSVYNIFMVEDGQDFSRSVGGKYTVSITSDSSVDSVRLEGENANDFTIDTGGTIHIAQGIVIDINKTKEYNLGVIAKNSFGESEPAEVIIKVHNKAFMSFSPKDNEQTKDIVMVDLKKDIQGNMYVFGYRVKDNEKTPALIKYDNAQNIEWIKDFNVTVKTENDYIYLSELKLYIDDKRTLYLLGDIYGGTLENSISDDNQTIGNRDVFAIALDTNGTSKWIKQFGTSGYDRLVGMLMENDKLYVAVNIPNQYDVDNNASTLSEGVVYILDSSGSIQNVVQFDEINIEKIDAWNLRNNYQGFIVYSKLNNIDSVIKLDSNFSFESTYIIDKEYNIYGVFVFDDVAYTVFNSYQSIRIVKHGDNGEIWSTEEDIGERVLDVQVYHQNTGTKVLFNAGDMWTYEGMVAGCIGYYFAYDMQGEIVERRYYGLRDYPCSNPFLIDGKIYLLEQKY